LIAAKAVPSSGLGWRCRLCHNDDAVATVAGSSLRASSTTGAAPSAQKLASLHEAFEKTFCNKLSMSGSANFANVHQCSFRFVDTPLEAAHASIAEY
jgi:hypothetical protein